MAPSLILLVACRSASVPILVLLSGGAQSISLSALLYCINSVIDTIYVFK